VFRSPGDLRVQVKLMLRTCYLLGISCLCLCGLECAKWMFKEIPFFQNTRYKSIRNYLKNSLSRRLPTAAAWVRAWARSCGICGGQSETGAGFLRVLRFPLSIRIPPIAPHSSSSIIWGWYNRPVVAAVPSGHSLTP
jgi:hypothetical protein